MPPPIAAKRSIRRGILLLTGDVWRRRQDADISSEITQKKIKIDSEVTLYLFHCMDTVRTHHFLSLVRVLFSELLSFVAVPEGKGRETETKK